MPRRTTKSRRPQTDRRKQPERRSVPRGGRREVDVQSLAVARCPDGVAPLLLVVDDYRDGREMVSEYLTHLGYRVETAPTGSEALEKVARLRPELVVMDVLLPDGDGLDFVTRIRASTTSPKIVVCTAAVIGDVRVRARAAHVDIFVPKPCDLIVLARQIRHLLLQAPVASGAA